MKTLLKKSTVILVALFAAAQLVRPLRANPPLDASRSIQAQPGTSAELGAVLSRSCRDCHSNETVWPPISQIAPLSWLMSYAIKEGRRAVNFSEWAAYAPETQRALLGLSCQDVSAGRMPSAYTWVRPETRLSQHDIEVICAAARRQP